MATTGRRGLVPRTQGVVSIAAFILMTVLFGYMPILAYAQTATTTATDATTTSATTTDSTSSPQATSNSSVQASSTQAAATTTISVATSTAATTTPVATTTPPVIHTNVGIEAQVRSYFASSPVMIAIANCESGYRQFNPSGNPLNGGSGGMIGIFQISNSTHAAVARSMGMDIMTVAGNMAYANYLYQKEGTGPWLSSFPCWNPIVNPTASAQNGPASALLHSNLVLGTISPEVVTLQQLLNKTSTPIATSGPGSPGQETTIFGGLTRVAVRAFQCAQNIVCSGDEYSTGYGAVGPATRTALLNLSGSTVAVATVPVPNNTTPLPGASTVTSPPDNSAEIAQLRVQIAQLEAILAALIKARSA